MPFNNSHTSPDEKSSQTFPIVVIGRQFGCGGREIGRLIAKRLNAGYYDKTLLSKTAQSLGFDISIFDSADEKRPSWLRSLLSYSYGTESAGIEGLDIDNEGLYKLQSQVIRKLADEDMSVRLAVSLHTPDDELRDTLVPINNRFSVAEVLDAARYYADKSGRRVSIEYALIRDINDQGWRADMLGKKLHKALGSRVHVNLIPLNPTPGSKWDASPKAQQDEFVRRVRAQGVPCTVRDTRGNEIAAACGQLAAEGA